MGGGMGGMGPRAGPDDAHAMDRDARIAGIAPVLIDAVQRGLSVQEVAEMIQIPENQTAHLMQAVREGVSTRIAFLHSYKTFCSVLSHFSDDLRYRSARSAATTSWSRLQILKFL